MLCPMLGTSERDESRRTRKRKRKRERGKERDSGEEGKEERWRERDIGGGEREKDSTSKLLREAEVREERLRLRGHVVYVVELHSVDAAAPLASC